jgi:hypothetical protein
MNMPFFTEEQRFDQRWLQLLLWLYFLTMAVLATYAGYREHVLKDPWGGPDFVDGGLFLVFLIHFGAAFLILMLFKSMKLTTQVRTDGIYIRYMPFHLFKGVLISPADVASQEPVTYHPILEYGGWGIRYKWGLKKKAYNVRGNRGVLLTYTDGRTLLIGSQEPEMLSQTIQSIMG